MLVLVRHGQAIKNLERRHGGSGTPLTDTGQEQVLRLARKIADLGLRPKAILYTDRPQCDETAEILKERFSVPGSEVGRLEMKPYSLGVIAGLSEDECHQQFPELARRMDRYRCGDLEIADVAIPGASDAEAFSGEAKKVLDNLLLEASASMTMVVATRSILVALVNTIRGLTPRVGGGYREVPWGNCGYCVVNPRTRAIEFVNDVGL